VPRIAHTPHGHVFFGYFNSLVTKLFLFVEMATAKITDTFVALTENEKNESLGFGVGRRDQWTVVPSGVVIDETVAAQKNELRRHIRASLDIQDSDLAIGMVGRLDPIKGARVLGEAADILLERFSAEGDPRLFFLFIGEGPDRAALEAMKARWPEPDSLILLGHRPRPWPFMAALDIYAQPSLNEGMGKTLVMAQSLGLPVAASRVSGIPDVVIDGKTGILVPPSEPAFLADALARLIADAPLRARLGAAGAAWVREKINGQGRFSVERMISLLEKIYAE
jgi:glycosyltransferase involved in cell wall biosynthesis